MSTASSDWEGGSPWLFLLGLLVFLGSALLFLADLARDVDVLRSLVANTLGAALLITWAAHDTLHDPNSEVATTGGAAGTALLLYGLYLLGAGIVIAITSVFHDRLVLGLLYAAVAFVAATVGFLIFPTEAVLEDGTADEDDRNTEGDSTAEDAAGGEGDDSGEDDSAVEDAVGGRDDDTDAAAVGEGDTGSRENDAGTAVTDGDDDGA
jgi:hypothetical protein